jgi:S1-C subfamily serine protease
MNRKITGLKITLTLILISAISGCSPENKDTQIMSAPDSKVGANVIYGTDGRLDVYQLTDDRLRALADSTVALVKSTNLISNSQGQTSVRGDNFGTQMNLCSSEKFREQDTAAFCSGSLVGPDLVLTAGHCIESESDCLSTSLVFGFAVKSVGLLPKQVQTSEVYKCAQVIKTIRNNSGQDFAVIRLNRSVQNHAVLQIRQFGELSVGDDLVVIGHPVGLPTKVTTGGKVRSTANAQYIVASVDTYGGNSGSAVFNAQSGLIEGILVRGETDFASQGGCTVSKVCTENSCRGEDITRISMARPFIPESSTGAGPSDPQPTPVQEPEMFSVDAQIAIPDNRSTGINSVLQVTSVPAGRKVIISVDITHTYIGDLSIEVVAPNGKSVVLHNRAGARTVNLKKSYDVTSTLGQVDQSGFYKIYVKDLASVDVGVLKTWSVEFK